MQRGLSIGRFVFAATLFCAVVKLSGTADAETDAPRTVGNIERLDPALDELVSPDAKMEVIGEGYCLVRRPGLDSRRQLPVVLRHSEQRDHALGRESRAASCI